jgi:hypothetical protein
MALDEFGVIPWALGDLVGESFPVSNGADKLFADLSSIFEFAPVDHVETGDTNRVTFIRDFDIGF